MERSPVAYSVGPGSVRYRRRRRLARCAARRALPALGLLVAFLAGVLVGLRGGGERHGAVSVAHAARASHALAPTWGSEPVEFLPALDPWERAVIAAVQTGRTPPPDPRAAGPTARPAPAPVPAAEPRAAVQRLSPRARVAGLVLEERGGPIEGARVRLLVGSRRRREVRTGVDGGFALDNLAAGRYTVHAYARGFLPARVPGPVDLSPGGARTDLVLRLRAALAIEGTVRTRDGKPVRGARVWVRRGGAFPTIAVRTDAAGRYRLLGGAPGRNRVYVRHPAYLPPRPRVVSLRAGEGATGIDFVLRAGGAIRLGVHDEAGRPLAIPLWLYDRRGRLVARGRSRDGRARWTGLRSGRYTVFGADEHGRAGRVRIAVRAGRTARAQLVLETGGQVSGRVTDPEGAGVSGVRVRAERLGGRWAREVRTGADGRFEIAGLVEGRYRVRVVPRGAHAPPAPLTLPVAPGQVWSGVAFRLRAGAVVRGEVRAADGGPAGGAIVMAYAPGGSALRSARARADGSFVLEGLPRERLHLFARLGTELAHEPLRIAEPEPPPVRLWCDPMGELRGRVVSLSGRVLRGARVGAQAIEGIVRRRARADRRGRFALRYLYPATYRVWAIAGQQQTERTIVIRPGERIDGFELVIPLP
ncbi:MAG: carboxypeptidase regulatory-like domain-containing protein [Planctomycetota bacterium]|nr:MAG: carboxypeptidase regulatory-like domain-containing protein [Planctomycetota bacterium]